ncbi:MAG TPA: DUF89 family protein [Desulfobacterales bacterium]|nr:DUF89 family protein [Desulfobacterales bacterium]
MQTALDCLPCLLRQALFAGRTAGADKAVLRVIVQEAAALLAKADLSLSPPENAAPLYRLIAQRTGASDPFARLKRESNEQAAAMTRNIRQWLMQEDAPLRTALILTIAGNVMDYGSPHGLDPADFLARCRQTPLALDHTNALLADLAAARSVLVLADNCGEILFDALLLELLADKRLWLAVKSRPVINDATKDDALALGLDRLAEVIANGTDIPGTALHRCSPAFAEVFRQADVVISKGQGNFETLCDTERQVYFLFTVKCAVVAGHLAERTGKRFATGDMILARNNWPRQRLPRG